MNLAGHISWPAERPLWEFDYRLGGRVVFAGSRLVLAEPETEGIAVTKVHFKGHLVLFKASLAMIRVHYDFVSLGPFFPPTVGPFKDPLTAFNSTLMTGSASFRSGVEVREGVTQEGIRFLVVDSGHTVGAYRLTGRWIFREDGIILPQFYSAGLRFPANHRHHAYWRLDFDIDGANDNLVLTRLDWFPVDWGWGKCWKPVTSESSFHRPGVSRVAVVNKTTARGYQVFPGPSDGISDGFSQQDFWVQRFRVSEDRKGALGTEYDDQLLTLQNGELTDGVDIVLWYTAHLSHEIGHGGDEWHSCGPILMPFGF